MFNVLERHTLSPALILDIEDAFARQNSRPGIINHALEPLHFFLTQRNAAGVVTVFDPPIELDVQRSPGGYHLFFGRELQIYGGRFRSTRKLDLSPGSYTLRITSPHYQTIEKALTLPMGDPNAAAAMNKYRITVEPSHLYPFPGAVSLGQVTGKTFGGFPPGRGPTLLRGVLMGTAGQGMAGMKIWVDKRSNTFVTDDSGQWVLWFKDNQPSGPVVVTIEAPQAAAIQVPDVYIVHGCETSLHQTCLRGRVVSRQLGLPGAVISVAGFAGHSVSNASGGWKFAFPFGREPQAAQVRVSVTGAPDQTRSVEPAPRATLTLEPFQF